MDSAGQTASSEGLWTTAGLLAALAASSCCVFPLLLALVGIGGAWVSWLTALEPYRPYLLGIAFVALGGAFWHVYGKKPVACEPGTSCAVPASRRWTKMALWTATLLAVVSATVGLWAPLFY
jgi:mercuric ion transport protein